MKFDGCPSKLCKRPGCCSAIAHSYRSSPSFPVLCPWDCCVLLSVWCWRALAGHQSVLPEEDGLRCARGDQLEQWEQAVCFRNPVVAHLFLKGSLVDGQRGGAFCSVGSWEAKDGVFKEGSFLCTEQSPIFGLVVRNTLAFKNERTNRIPNTGVSIRKTPLSFRRAFNAWDAGKNFWPHRVFHTL